VAYLELVDENGNGVELVGLLHAPEKCKDAERCRVKRTVKGVSRWGRVVVEAGVVRGGDALVGFGGCGRWVGMLLLLLLLCCQPQQASL
jgi:hypothetical protein